MYFIKKRKSKRLILREEVKINCVFQAQKFNKEGIITYQGPKFHNTIFDSGLDLLHEGVLRVGDRLGPWGGAGDYINVGTGSSTPATSQTGLDSFLASTGNIYGSLSKNSDTSIPRHVWQTAVFEFAIGSCTGNLTEVGLSSAENSNYFNRQLFKDAEGSPTTITVLADEGLRVTATLYLYEDLAPGDTETGSFLFNGTDTINFTREKSTDTDWLTADVDALVNFRAGQMQIAELSGETDLFIGGTTADSVTAKTYSSGDYYLDYDYVWNAASFVGDIASIHFPFLHLYRQYADPFSAFRLSPVITLTDTEEFRLTLRRGWGRYVA